MIDVAVTLAMPCGPDQYWRAMRDHTDSRGAFTISEITIASSGVTREAVRKYILSCVKQGFVEQTGQIAREKTYRVIKKRAKAPVMVMRPENDGKRGQVRANMWTAMRTLGSFTTHELSAAASTDEVAVPLATAQRYVYQLRVAGLLAVVKDGGKREASLYRLKPSANSGPQCPRVFAAHIVFDQNTKKVVGKTDASEVAP